MPNMGRILYEGPSTLDGEPIVAIATFGSRNRKTGDMVQTWILRADVDPVTASQIGADISVCWNCPQRWYTGGGCYVDLGRAPLSVFRAYLAGAYLPLSDEDRPRFASRPIRIGAYGDPAAVPTWVWEDLLAQGSHRWTGYTHQWRTTPSLRGLVMASCDGPEDYAAATAAGWRAFVVTDGEAVDGAIECPSERGVSCRDCTACDGTRADSREAGASSVWIGAHGARTSAALRVLR